MIEPSERWRNTYPGSVVGILAMRSARNLARHEGLDAVAESVESKLREEFFAGGREALKAHPVIAAYEAYYRRFRKTYHVTLQIESVVWKNRGIPSVSSVVKAMFMAELSSMLLTAGHDLSRVVQPIRLDVGVGTESYTALGNSERIVKDRDMMIADAVGILSSIIGGPDQRTSISMETRDLLFTVYAPAGIGAERVRAHLENLHGYVELASPGAVVERIEAFTAE